LRGGGVALREIAADGVPKLDFEHPRVKAAMKVTGIQANDLTGKCPGLKRLQQSPATPSSARSPGKAGGAKAEEKDGSQTARADALARTKDLWERKQVLLLREVEETADAMENEDVEAILSPTNFEHSTRVSEKEKERVERMREHFKAQLQRDAKRRLDRTSVQDAAMKKRDELENTLAERAGEKNEELEVEAEKRKLQHQKARERVVVGMKELAQRRKDISARLASQGEHVAAMLKDRFSGESEKQQEIQNRMAKIATQAMAQEQADLEKNAHRIEEAVQRSHEVETRLVQAREEQALKLQERRIKFSGKLGVVSAAQAQKEQEREKQFLEKAEKLQASKLALTTKAKEEADANKEARDKQLVRWTTNRQRIGGEKRREFKELRSKFSECQQKVEAGREQYMEEQAFAKTANRTVLEELVDANRARLARSLESSREQTLAKVERDRARTATAEEQKKQIERERMAVIKDSMEGRTKLEELRKLDPTAGQTHERRMNEILEHLGMDPWSPKQTVKEGEEGQQP